VGRFLKFLAWLAAAFVAVGIVAIVLVTLLFDPNDFRDDIEAAVENRTGRELTIAGQIDLSLFPWLAIDVGSVELGNAPGFGDEPFARFDNVRFSVRLLPLLLKRRVTVGTAAIDGLVMNLAVDANGRSNWDDLAEAAAAAGTEEPQVAPGETADPPPALDVSSIEINDAAVSYVDRQSGSGYRITGLNLDSGRVGFGEPVPLSGSLLFAVEPDGITGDATLDVTVDFDPDAERILVSGLKLAATANGLVDVPVTLALEAPTIDVYSGVQTLAAGSLSVSALDVDLRADVDPFSYAGDPVIDAKLSIAAFSPKSLMRTLAIEVPETADPDALGRLRAETRARIAGDAIALTGLELKLDDTTFNGSLTLPTDPAQRIEAELEGDRIDITRYMAPADAEAVEEDASATVELPVELIEPLNARASFALGKVLFGELEFDNIEIVANAGGGKLRIHPISADFYGGGYRGDVRIDASGNVPVLSVDETIADVSLTPLAEALYQRSDITGTINGNFKLSGRGADIDAIRRDLDGTMRFEFADGALVGTDIWYEIRRARALIRQEPAPKAPSPPRTEFSTVKMSGVVTDGVMKSDDLFAQIPYMQVTGAGRVNFVEQTLDWSVRGRILERPEFVDASAAELDEYTEAVVPFKVSGPLARPKVGVDVESLVKEKMKEKVREKLLEELMGDEEPAAEGEEPKEKDAEDVAKDLLKDLLNR